MNVWVAFIAGAFVWVPLGIFAAAFCFAKARHKPGPLDYDAPPRARKAPPSPWPGPFDTTTYH